MTRVLVFVLLLFSALPAGATGTESVYDRILQTRTIRCGYFVGAPYIIKDPNTGALSGIWHDFTEAMGQALGFQIAWTAEVGLGDFGAALDSGKIDVMCFGLWVDPARAKAADFVTPISYNGVRAYVREDDTRFDFKYGAINDPSVTISFIDGDVASTIALRDFPRAKTLSLPQLSTVADAMDNVTQRKADVVFFTPAVVAVYNASHTKKLRQIPLKRMIRVYEESMALRRNEHELRRLLDNTTRFLINNGVADTIIRKYDPERTTFLPLAKPYEGNAE